MSTAAPSISSPRRRRLLFSGLAVTALGVGGWATHVYRQRGIEQGKLTASGREVLRHLCRGILAGLLPQDAAKKEAVLAELMGVLDHGVARLTPLVQQQMGLLLGSLSSAPSRLVLTGHWRSFRHASDTDMVDLLDQMRLSGNPLIQLTYRSVRSFVCIQCFSWAPFAARLPGYPGPMVI